MPDLAVLLVAEPAYFFAYMVFAMVGFGTTLIAAHVIPVPMFVPAQALLDLLAALSNGIRLNTHVARAEVIRLVPSMLLGSAFGAYILFAVPLDALMLLLGVFVMLYAINGLRPKRQPPLISSTWAWWYGGSGGMLSALFGAGGWVYAIYLMRRIEDPQAIRATQMTLIIVSAVIRVGLFAAAGQYMGVNLLALAAVLLPAMMLGLFVGNRITLKMNRKQFMRMLYFVLLITGASLISRAIL